MLLCFMLCLGCTAMLEPSHTNNMSMPGNSTSRCYSKERFVEYVCRRAASHSGQAAGVAGRTLGKSMRVGFGQYIEDSQAWLKYSFLQDPPSSIDTSLPP